MTMPMGARSACLIGLVALLALHAACNIWWLRNDNHPITADEALHMQFAESFYRALFAPGDADWGTRLSDAAAIETIYPPLLHVMGAALWIFMPYSAEALAFASTIAFLALLAGVYALTAAFFSPQRALLAAVLVGFTPFLFGASRLYIQDVLAATFVVWTIYAACRTQGFQRSGWVVAFALLAGLGLLARWTTPLYYAFPVLLILAAGAAPAMRDPATRGKAMVRIGANAGVLLALALVVALPWYWARLETLRTGYDDIFAGRQGAITWGSFNDWTAYLIYIINTGTFLPLFLLAIAGFAVMLRRREERFAGAMLLLWVVAAYVLLTATWSIKSPAPRYVVPFLPAFGIAAAAAFAALPKGRLRAVGATTVMAVMLLQYANLTFRPIPPLQRIEIPVFTQHPTVQSLGQGGVVVLRERVRASAARYYAAYRGENWLERTLTTMRSEDRFRHMAGSPRLQYALVRLPKVGLERLQSYYVPNPLGDRAYDLHTEPVGFTGLPTMPPEELPGNPAPTGGLVAWFNRPKPVSGFSVTYADEDAMHVRLIPEYWNPMTGSWQPFGPYSIPPARQGRTVFQQTARVLTQGVRLVPARASLEPQIEDVGWYAAIYPNRPLALMATGNSIEEIQPDLMGVEYLIVANLREEEREQLQDRFLLIAQFPAHLSGFWEPVEISILTRFTVLPR